MAQPKEQPRLELAYQVFEGMLTRRTGALPDGVRHYLRAAYFSGAAGMISTSKLIAALPADQQQEASDRIAMEINEVLK